MPSTFAPPADLQHTAPPALTSYRTGALSGRIRVPGDKSISHRALMLGAVAAGETVIHGLLEGEDVLRTAAAMRALGAAAARTPDGAWRVTGPGIGALVEPAGVLDMGNSGTGSRLLAGLLASHGLTAFLTGDASLLQRPMARVTTPLEQMGARFVTRRGGRMPMAVIGTDAAVPIRYELPVASAQVKSAILLAGLNAAGRTTVVERRPTRDHSEHMLRHFGAEIAVEPLGGSAGEAITVTGPARLAGCTVRVPGDISSAAFLVVAALIRPDSDLVIEEVGLNPRRRGLIDTLIEMGGDITLMNPRLEAGEPVADLRVRGSELRGVEVPPDRAPSMIDEYPVLAVAAACAHGTTRMLGLAELRVKESDRLAMMATGLAACGAAVESGEDWLSVTGSGGAPAGGAVVATALDHRIAMSFLVLGTATAAPVGVDDAAPIETSFPGFAALMNRVGARVAAGSGPGAAGDHGGR